MIVLGIESTCDETAVALVRDGVEVLSHEIASSVDLHASYGGVFPELACQRHAEVIAPLVSLSLESANIDPQQIDLIAVAKGPGLVGALLIGMQMAKGLSIAWKKPFIGVDHVEAHLYAAMMGAPLPWLFPALGLILSGGHTLLLEIEGVGTYRKIGTTADDAIGEAFDKVGVLLGLSYPGGAKVERLAEKGSPHIPFKAGRIKTSPFDFSFSGIKTSVLYATQKGIYSPEDIAASFQRAVISDLIQKTELAQKKFSPQAIYFGGGVCNNEALRKAFASHFDLPLFWPPPQLSSDNAVMIAGLGFQQFVCQGKKGDPLDLDVASRIVYRT